MAEDGSTTDPLDLSKLLAALAAGVRSAQKLPLDDDFNFASSLPDFSEPLQEAQQTWLSVIQQIITTEATDIHDPQLWEDCADNCEAMLEQAQGAFKDTAQIQQLASVARHHARSQLASMVQNTVDMEKPQEKYKIIPHNSRTEPFVPNVHPEKPFGVAPLDLSLQAGHGLDETRFPKDVLAPSQHVKHPYQQEIEQFEYTPEQLRVDVQDKKIAHVAQLDATWIDTATDLETLVDTIATQNVTVLAIDLEAHSYRSFAGITCLLQMSFRDQRQEIRNYLVDTLACRHDMHILAPPLANPDIVKVMHGANQDVQWLQRDFGLYIVNLFDTGRAARALQFASAGYAYLLQRYVGIAADKSLQLADWRQRPLTARMKHYAIQDTYYLLDIYDRLKFELNDIDALKKVLDESREICLIRYNGEPFNPSGYQKLLHRRGRHTTLTSVQTHILKSLWDWRDETARQHDESLPYVCPNEALIRLATLQPQTVAALQQVFSPMPALVLSYANEILNRIKKMVQQDEDDDDEEDEEIQLRTPSTSAFFKPADDNRRGGMMSPVLGTEALYKQAGWMTPLEQITSDDEEKRATLSVNASNKNFTAKQLAEHSLVIGTSSNTSRGRTVDGLATVRASREGSESPLDEETKLAHQTSARIRSYKESIPAILGLVNPSTEVDEEDVADEGDTATRDKDTETDDEEFAIPRSVREIYKISNRNRQRKKAGSPTPERGVTPTNEKEREELAKAEALLRERGLIGPGGYFDDGQGSPGKRPRTKSKTGRDSEESVPQDSSFASKEDDMAFMKSIGYVNEEETVNTMLSRQHFSESHSTGYVPYDYGSLGHIGALSQTPVSNPFFEGAALAGGPLSQGNIGNKSKKAVSPTKNKPKKQQERPEKRDGQTYAYRKR